ncbi:MAG: hypothetical protein HYX24_03630 [Candidatus Aenigmarchaeota archaeon]|nr:hypothetical protein [Candidatus Aenigmarchaeota archaeon]
MRSAVKWLAIVIMPFALLAYSVSAELKMNGYPCSSDGECESGFCKQDFTGRRYCSPANSCMYDKDYDDIAELYLNGQTPDNLHYCVNGAWMTCREGIIGNQCCNTVPITFNSPISESCLRSSVPVHPTANCNVGSASISFYLDSTKVRDGCTAGGDVNWNIDGRANCEVKIPSGMATGKYAMTGRYTINSKEYTVEVRNPKSNTGKLDVKSACDTNSQCSHVLFVLSPVSPGTFSFTPEYAVDGSSYVLPPNATARLKNGQAYVMECSDGVVYSSTPGIVAWTYKDSSLVNVSNNKIFGSPACTISGRDRSTVIGKVSDTRGFIPSSCDIGIHGAQSKEVNLGTFAQGGHYNIKEDLIHAWCDAPDYICPWLGGSWRNSICRYGYANTPERSTGWVPLKEYNFTVIDPHLTISTDGHKIYTINTAAPQNIVNALINLKNTGIGKLKINFLKVSCSVGCVEPGYVEMIDENKGQDVLLQIDINEVADLQHSEPENYDSFETYGTQNTVQILNFTYVAKVDMGYDDAYNFTTVGRRNETTLIPISVLRVCNDQFHEKQSVVIEDSVYFCAYRGGVWQWAVERTYIDRIVPSSYSLAKNAYFSNSTQLAVYWDSTEPQSVYSLQYRVSDAQNIGSWTDWLGTAEKSAVFGPQQPTVMEEGKTYSFRVKGSNMIWSKEKSTTVDLSPPSCQIIANPYLPLNFTISYEASDNLSGVKSAELEMKKEGEDWKTLSGNCSVFGGKAVCILSPAKYSFRCRATDYAGNRGNYSPEKSAIVTDNTLIIPLSRWMSSYSQEWVPPRGFRVSFDGMYHSVATSCYNFKRTSAQMGSQPVPNPDQWNDINLNGSACIPGGRKSIVFSSDVADGYTYYFMVRAINADGEKEPWPNLISQTINDTMRVANTTVDTIPPLVAMKALDNDGNTLPVSDSIIVSSKGLEIVVTASDGISGIRQTRIAGVQKGRTERNFSVECSSSECRYKPVLNVDDNLTFTASAQDNALNVNLAGAKGSVIKCFQNSDCPQDNVCNRQLLICTPPLTVCRDSVFCAMRHPLAYFTVHSIASLIGSGEKQVSVRVRNLKQKRVDIEVELGLYKLTRFRQPSSSFEYVLDDSRKKAKIELNPREERTLAVGILTADLGSHDIFLKAYDSDGLEDSDKLRLVVDLPAGFEELDERAIVIIAAISVGLFYFLALRRGRQI